MDSRKNVAENKSRKYPYPKKTPFEYEEPDIEIPNTGSNPFWAIAVCILCVGAIFVLALI